MWGRRSSALIAQVIVIVDVTYLLVSLTRIPVAGHLSLSPSSRSLDTPPPREDAPRLGRKQGNMIHFIAAH